jgi:hypothetical protein
MISYRYQTVNDNIVNTFLYHVVKFIDEAKKSAKEQMAQERLEANKHLTDAGETVSTNRVSSGKWKTIYFMMIYYYNKVKI